MFGRVGKNSIFELSILFSFLVVFIFMIKHVLHMDISDTVLTISLSMTPLFIGLNMFLMKNSQKKIRDFTFLSILFLAMGLVFSGFFSVNDDNEKSNVTGFKGLDIVILIISFLAWIGLIFYLFVRMFYEIWHRSDYVITAWYLQYKGTLHVNSNQLFFDSEHAQIGIKRNDIFSIKQDGECLAVKKGNEISVELTTVLFKVMNPEDVVKKIQEIIN